MDRNEISDDNIVKISPFYGSLELSINILTTVPTCILLEY